MSRWDERRDRIAFNAFFTGEIIERRAVMGYIADCFSRAINGGVESKDVNFCVSLESKNDSTQWIQIAGDAINAAYPFDENPIKQLGNLKILLPGGIELDQWEKRKFVTFNHCGGPIEELAQFVTDYSTILLNLKDNEDELVMSEELM